MPLSRRVFVTSTVRWLTAGAMARALSACGGSGSDAASPAAPTLTVSGAATQVLAGAKAIALTATANASAGTLGWSLGAGSPGTLSAASGTSVSYLPPATVAAITPVTVNVTGTGVARTFTVTVYPDPGAAGLSLIAGDLGGYGQFDGTGRDARFHKITAMAMDGRGNTIVATRQIFLPGNVSLRKVSAAGVVTTILDSGTGYVDGPLASARLGVIGSVTVDADGTIFALDDNGIRRISGGLVSTLSTAFKARDNPLTSIVADGTGGLYVAEPTRISRVAGNGAVTFLAGAADSTEGIVDGQGSAARFSYLRDIAIDRAGTLYVLDAFSVRKVTADAQVTTLAGGNTGVGANDGVGARAMFAGPVALAVDAGGDLLVLDNTAETIDGGGTSMAQRVRLKALRRVTQAGVVTSFKYGLNVELMRADAAGRVILAGAAELSVLAADNTVVPLAGNGDDTLTDLDGRGEQARLRGPVDLVADAMGNLYVLELNRGFSYATTGDPVPSDVTGLNLRKIAPDGTVTTLASESVWWGQPWAAQARIAKPGSIAIDSQGNLYISENLVRTGFMTFTEGGGSIVKITPAGVASVFAGTYGQPVGQGAQVDGTGTAARFADGAVLRGFDADGNLYVDDGKIRKITPQQVVTTVAALPAGLGADAEGNTYVRDRETVVRVASNATRTVVAGTPGRVFNQTGPLPGALYQRGGLTRTGPASFALVSGSAVLRLVLPH